MDLVNIGHIISEIKAENYSVQKVEAKKFPKHHTSSAPVFSLAMNRPMNQWNNHIFQGKKCGRGLSCEGRVSGRVENWIQSRQLNPNLSMDHSQWATGTAQNTEQQFSVVSEDIVGEHCIIYFYKEMSVFLTSSQQNLLLEVKWTLSPCVCRTLRYSISCKCVLHAV